MKDQCPDQRKADRILPLSPVKSAYCVSWVKYIIYIKNVSTTIKARPGATS